MKAVNMKNDLPNHFLKVELSRNSEACKGSSVNLHFDDIALLSVHLEFNTNDYGRLSYYADCKANCAR